MCRTSHRCSSIEMGDVRLVNGNTVKEGRVDICYDGIWYSACDDNWGSNEARVVCRQLGCRGGENLYTYTDPLIMSLFQYTVSVFD